MKKEILKQRMYGFVMYQFGATIHAGIQYGHAKDEFILKYWKTKELQQWLRKDKVYVILNGGTTNTEFGTLQNNIKQLNSFGIKNTIFREEDMDNIITSVAFLIDERVFDKKKYPSLDDLNSDYYKTHQMEMLIDEDEFIKLKKQAEKLEKIGIFEKREWLSKFRLSGL
jgi:hypothetical protein